DFDVVIDRTADLFNLERIKAFAFLQTTLELRGDQRGGKEQRGDTQESCEFHRAKSPFKKLGKSRVMINSYSESYDLLKNSRQESGRIPNARWVAVIVGAGWRNASLCQHCRSLATADGRMKVDFAVRGNWRKQSSRTHRTVNRYADPRCKRIATCEPSPQPRKSLFERGNNHANRVAVDFDGRKPVGQLAQLRWQIYFGHRALFRPLSLRRASLPTAV